MLYLILGIIILTILEYLIIRNINKLLKLTSILTIISGYLTIILGLIFKIIIDKKINFINISKITTTISKQIIEKGLILILLGGIELIIYILVIIYQKKKNY